MRSLRSFGDLESAVMDQLWAAGHPMLVREVLEGLQEDRPLAYTTVMTVMDKLHRKGWLTREREGRAYVYQPSAPREAYAAQLMSQAFTQADDATATLIRFIDAMSPDEAAALDRALSERLNTDSKNEL